MGAGRSGLAVYEPNAPTLLASNTSCIMVATMMKGRAQHPKAASLFDTVTVELG